MHVDALLLRGSVGGPVLGIGEVGQVVGPVREVKRKIFVSLLPDITDLFAVVDDEVLHSKGVEPGSKGQTVLTTTDDQYLRFDRVNILSSLLFPADSTSHMPISRLNLRELLELLSNCVESVDLPAILGENGVGNGRSVHDLGLERHDELKLGIVRVWTVDLGGGCEELEVGGFGYREEVGGGL